MDSSRVNYLFEQYQSGSATEQERAELLELFERFPNQEAVTEILIKEMASQTSFTDVHPAQWQGIVEKILQHRQVSAAPVISIFNWKKIAVAASVLLVVGTAIWLAFFSKPGKTEIVTNIPQHGQDVAPGRDGAILTLADGSTIVLDDAQDGKITDIAIKDGNRVSYEKSTQSRVEYNTMSTPKGRQFSLVLPDGTQVWLNAASSITYPTAFIGNERKVSITGEAYFEVVHNAHKPFHVDVNGMDVQVLGTHFNINSYSDEGTIKTTLLEGSIKVSVAGKTQFVKPGQQAEVNGGSQIKMVNDADIDLVMAWKNGRFQFSDASLQQVMRQIQRWYDVDVVYEGNIPDKIFEGKISRQSNLSQVMKILQESGINFEIADRKLIVKP